MHFDIPVRKKSFPPKRQKNCSIKQKSGLQIHMKSDL